MPGASHSSLSCVWQTVTSLDLVALHPEVIACDMTQSPSEDTTQDIAIFSLSLMGTDYHQCILDAARVLKIGGLLWIAEVFNFARLEIGTGLLL